MNACAVWLFAALAGVGRAEEPRAPSTPQTSRPSQPVGFSHQPSDRGQQTDNLPAEEPVDRHRFQTNIGDEHFVPVPRSSATYFRDDDGARMANRLNFFDQPMSEQFDALGNEPPEPRWLRRPDESLAPDGFDFRAPQPEPWVSPVFQRPVGFAGRSRVLPTDA